MCLKENHQRKDHPIRRRSRPVYQNAVNNEIICEKIHHRNEVYDRPFYVNEADNGVYRKDAVETMSKMRPVYKNEVMPDICG